MKQSQKKVLVIIPAYNEEKNIGKVLDQLNASDMADLMDVLVINDASTDQTRQVVLDHNCLVVSNIFNMGYGCGLQVGYKYARMHGYSYVIQMDADGQHDVCNLKPIYEALTTPDEEGRVPDLVLGSRFMKGQEKYPSSAVKQFAYSLFRGMIYLGTHTKICDPTTGLQGLDRKAFCFYAGYRHFDDQYPDANMIMQMLLLGFRVVEIPAVMHVRTEGVSMHSGIKPFIYMFRMVFSIWAVWLREKVFHIDREAKELHV